MSSSQIHGQTFQILGDKAYGGLQRDKQPLLIKVDSTHLIISGSSASNISGNKTDPQCDSNAVSLGDAWIIKIDTAFNVIWDHSIGGYRPESLGPWVIRNSNNNIVMAVGSRSDSTCEKSANNKGMTDYWIYACDLNGIKLWDFTFGGNSIDDGVQIAQLSTGHYLAIGSSTSPVSGDKSQPAFGPQADYWAIKFDSLGNKIWDKVYGGTGLELARVSGVWLYNMSIIPLDYGGFLFAGSTNSPQGGTISDTSRGQEDIWIAQMDSSGNIVWDKRFGGSGQDLVARIIKTSDSGYILCGQVESPQGLDVSDPPKGISGDCWIIKIDSIGNKQWDRRYGGNTKTIGMWIEEAIDGGYLISADVGGGVGFDVSEPAYGNQFDFWIFKIDSSGNKLWDKRFGGPSCCNIGCSFIQMPDSSIFLFGTSDTGTNAVKTDYGYGMDDIWVVHFKYIDNTSGINETSGQSLVSIFPNPSSGMITLPEKLIGSHLIVYDVAGRVVATINEIQYREIHLDKLSMGMYYLEFRTYERKFQAKWVRM